MPRRAPFRPSLLLLSAAVLAAGAALTAPPAAAVEDTQAPEATLLSVSPATVDVTCGKSAATVTVRVTDATGVDDAPHANYLQLYKTDGSSGLGGTSVTRIAGTATDGTYRGVFTLYPRADIDVSGSYAVILGFRDTRGNRAETPPWIPDVLTVKHDRSAGPCRTPGALPPTVALHGPHFASSGPISVAPGAAHSFRFASVAGDRLVVSTRTAPATAWTKAATLQLPRNTNVSTVNWALPFRPTRTTSVMVSGVNGSSRPFELRVSSSATIAGARAAGSAIRFSGRVVPAVAGRVVKVYGQPSSGFPIAQTRTSATGAYAVVANVPPHVKTFWAKTTDDAYNSGAESPDISVRGR